LNKPIKTGTLWCWLACVFACAAPVWLRAEEAASEDQMQLIIQFVGDADRETRAIGLQFIREEVPGEAATKRFAGLLPDLGPEAKADLLEALGDRGDAAALPAVIESVQSPEAAVRAAGLKAIGSLGGVSEVPLLAEWAAAGSDLEKSAARQALIRLRGEGVNQAIVAAMAGGKPEVRVELLGVLAARNAKEALPTVLQSAKAPEPAVRLAALGALRFLADAGDTAAIVGMLKATGDPAERRKAELALLTVCSRGRQACVEAILAGLDDADAPSRIALLHALARAGGPKALDAVLGRLKDENRAVRDEAMRMLSIWPDAAVAPHLMEIAKSGKNTRYQVLAIRGLVRLARPQEDKPADLKTLAQVMGLARRREEKQLVLGAISGVATPESLGLATDALDEAGLAEEAGLAAVIIAEKMEGGAKEAIRSAMEKVIKTVNNGQLRNRAQKVLDSL
jgi:HEAT repeat protein